MAFTANPDGVLRFVLDQDLCVEHPPFVLFQSQLLPLHPSPPRSAPCFWTMTRHCCNRPRRQMPTLPREAPRYPAWSQSQQSQLHRKPPQRGSGVVCDSLIGWGVKCKEVTEVTGQPQQVGQPSSELRMYQMMSNHASFNTAVLPHVLTT